MKSSLHSALHDHAYTGVSLLIGTLAVVLFALPATSLAATFDVTTDANGGPGSLRAAIINANNNPGADTISFSGSASGGCPMTISLTSLLPALTDAGTTINGTSCDVTLDGSALVGNEDGLRVRASDTKVMGLTIADFPRDGIRIQPNGSGTQAPVTGVIITQNVLTGNLDGLRVSGGEGPDNVVEASITHNTFDQNRDDGIFVIGSVDQADDGGNDVTVDISHNTILGSQGAVTGGALTGDGIRIFGGAGSSGQGVNGGNEVNASISHNTVQDNVDDGIIIAGSGSEGASNHVIDVEIIHNDVEDSGGLTSTAGNGIVIRGGDRNGGSELSTNNTITFVISKNNVSGSKDTGINVFGGLGTGHILSGEVSKNDVTTSGSNGINLDGGNGDQNLLENISVDKNNVSESGNNGMRMSGGNGANNTLTNIAVTKNSSVDNGAHGLVVANNGSDDAILLSEITKNKLNDNVRDGLLITGGVNGSGATQIEKNDAHKNGEDGIDINSVGYVLTKNKANDNVGAGIDAVGNTDGGGNQADGNGSCNGSGCF